MIPLAPATSPRTTSPEFWSMPLAAQVGQQGAHALCLPSLCDSPQPPTPLAFMLTVWTKKIFSVASSPTSSPKFSHLLHDPSLRAPSHHLLPS